MGIDNLLFTVPHGNPPSLSGSRARLEQLIAAAIDALDIIDGDPDIEDDDIDEEHDGAEEQHEQVPNFGIDQTQPWWRDSNMHGLGAGFMQ